MIRIGIVGTNYGRQVLIPAFRLDERCEVVALAGSDATRTAELAKQAGVPQAYGSWAEMIDRAQVDAVAIATPPRFQPDIARWALESGKAVFLEKPMAGDVAGAAGMVKVAGKTPTMIDLEFTEVPAWRKTKSLIDQGAIGRLRHIIVTWSVENKATRLKEKSWKTSAAAGGGALGNFASHSLHYLEWLCGPITELSGRLASLPSNPDMEVTALLSLGFASGAAGSYAMSCASFLGSGHRLEIYGEDGTLVLANTTPDYMRGFTLHYARRLAEALEPVKFEIDARDNPKHDGRIAPVSRLISRFIDAIEQRTQVKPGFAEGYRVQTLIDAARRSNEQGSIAIKVGP